MTPRTLQILLLLLLPVLGGCGDSIGYDLNCNLIGGNDDPVTLPFEQTFKSGLQLSIRAIPGRTDAVQVVARMQGFYEYVTVEWVQNGSSKKKCLVDGGLERYDFDFKELLPAADSVRAVNVLVVSRSKSGAR